MPRRRSRRVPVRGSLIGLAIWLGVVGLILSQADGPDRVSLRRILDAIRHVESGDIQDPPDGDGGLAIGPYQIHEVYWRDAVEHDPAIGGGWQDCRERAYAERVITAYMRRYAPGAWASGDAETIARIHNGGPAGANKTATWAYWRRVKARLDTRVE